MIVHCFGSGSDGNCWGVKSLYKSTTIILDAGINPDEMHNGLFDLANSYVLVTHEHGDHSKYAKRLAEDYGAKLVGTYGTLRALGLLDKPYALPLHYDQLLITEEKDEIRTIPVMHSAVEPCGFDVLLDGERLLYLTDLSSVDVESLPKIVDALIIEGNHTKNRLEELAEKNTDDDHAVQAKLSNSLQHLDITDTYVIAEPYLASLSMLIIGHTSKTNFDYEYYKANENISRDFKGLATFSVQGTTYVTRPFELERICSL